MIEDYQKFDYLEFHLSKIIERDGSKVQHQQLNKQVYVPASLAQEMKERGYNDPNQALHDMYFTGEQLADYDSSDHQAAPEAQIHKP